MDTNSPRYFVDKRTGCIAVRDRKYTNKDDQGLNPDMIGVVWYRAAPPLISTCDCCNRSVDKGWDVSYLLIKEANDVCNILNENEKRQNIWSEKVKE